MRTSAWPHRLTAFLSTAALLLNSACSQQQAEPQTRHSRTEIGPSTSSGDPQLPTDPNSPFSFPFRTVTDVNRRHVNYMFGGWGPHLRGLLADPKGTLWMALDTGSNVLVNPALAYYAMDGSTGGSWQKKATLALPATMQQNMASVLSNKFIYSYGVNVAQHWLMECYFNTEKHSNRACNAVTISGSVFSISKNSNYVGAAVSPTGTRLVWWTVVADNGGGVLQYIYNSGGGWNGPRVVTLGGYADLGYVYASFKSRNEVAMAGQLYLGGIFAAGYTQFKLGQNAAIHTPFRLASGNQKVVSSEDIFIDPVSFDVHVLARTFQGTVAYFHKKWQDSWTQHHDSLWTISDSLRGRFLPNQDKGVFVLVGGIPRSTKGLKLRYFPAIEASLALDWAKVAPTELDLTPMGIKYPSAIYVHAANYQTSALSLPRFAICGEAWAADNKIRQIDINIK